MRIGLDGQQRTNLLRLARTDLPTQWLSECANGWGEADLELWMQTLEREGYLPIDRQALQKHLVILNENTTPHARRSVGRSSASIDTMQKVERLAAAQWADPQEFAERRPFGTGDLWLNRSPIGGEALGYDDDRHVLVCCGSRSGKGTSTIMPQHMLWQGPLVSIDPSGENATVTAARRGEGNDVCIGMGQQVYVLDPMGVASVEDQYRARFNPLDALDPDEPKFLEKASALADGMIVRSAEEKEPFWSDKARTLIKGLILHIKTAPEFDGRRNLNTLRELATLGDQFMAKIVSEQTGLAEDPFKALFSGMRHNQSCGNVIPAIGQEFYNLLVKEVDRQWGGIHSALTNQTEFLESPLIQDTLSSSSFSLSELKDHPEGVSIYLCLPESDMTTYNRWLRMMVNLIDYEIRKSRALPACGQRVLMVLDEFAALERMEKIEEGISNAAKYGVKYMLILQNIGQLKKRYEKNWQTFMANTSVKLFFALDDDETAEEVSRRIGETDLTLMVEGQSVGTSTQETAGQSISTGRNEGGSTGSSHTTGWSKGTTQGVSKSKNRSFGSSDSMSRGGGSNRGVSTNKGSSENWNPPALLFRNTVEFMPMLRDGEGAGKNEGTSKNKGTSKNWNRTKATNQSEGESETLNVSESETQQESTSVTESKTWSESQTQSEQKSQSQGETRTTSRNQSFHKRPLIYPDELRRFFARAEQGDFSYPGLGLLEISGERPMVVQRTHYFEDKAFDGMWDRDPHHPDTQPALLERFWDVGFYLHERGGLWDEGEPWIARWLKHPGETVRRGEPIAVLKPGPCRTGLIDTALPIFAPVSGVMHEIGVEAGQAFDSGLVLCTIRYDLCGEMIERGVPVDEDAVDYNNRTHHAYQDYLQAVERNKQRLREEAERAEQERLDAERAKEKIRQQQEQEQRDLERRRRALENRRQAFLKRGQLQSVAIAVLTTTGLVTLGFILRPTAWWLIVTGLLLGPLLAGIVYTLKSTYNEAVMSNLLHLYDVNYWSLKRSRRNHWFRIRGGQWIVVYTGLFVGLWALLFILQSIMNDRWEETFDDFLTVVIHPGANLVIASIAAFLLLGYGCFRMLWWKVREGQPVAMNGQIFNGDRNDYIDDDAFREYLAKAHKDIL
jgi:type IV secretory pathway TraG/TraD family ATPase VirD4